MTVDDGGGGGVVYIDWERKVAEDLISETPEGLSVDWREYWGKREVTSDAMYLNRLASAFGKLLLERGVLSYDPDGHFLVIVWPLEWAYPTMGPVNLLGIYPPHMREVVFFTKLEYAQEWVNYWPGFKLDRYEYHIIESHSVQFGKPSAMVHSATA